ncbi:hypothetical protein MWN52_18035 [Pseudoxanthomonas winnipegensis]|uniref:hypothetical protein n=1 Tax=Pseudoxanthomonas winnipegensis TaxID=2480810 RepID=UPI0025760662|nr:hypothetical protein [Pseudoxanthomonas winnipegensis]WJI15475.1 hypothetical protein MWN52_18035 [Pseudoxanthomonas winnipegensis]
MKKVNYTKALACSLALVVSDVIISAITSVDPANVSSKTFLIAYLGDLLVSLSSTALILFIFARGLLDGIIKNSIAVACFYIAISIAASYAVLGYFHLSLIYFIDLGVTVLGALTGIVLGRLIPRKIRGAESLPSGD